MIKVLILRAIKQKFYPEKQISPDRLMKMLSKCFTLLAAYGLLSQAGISAQNQLQSIKAGFAERDITPSIGMEQPGGYGKVYHGTFHDACKVRVAVFDDGENRVAIVGVDALMLPRSLALEARKGIEEACGIKGPGVMIAASHSHSSGPLGMIQPGELDFASDLVKKLGYEESSMADAGYVQTVRKAIVDAVVLADRNKVPAKVGFGVGHEGSVSFNRRLRMKNGLTFSHPGAGNPDIVEYAGPIDPDVGVVAAWDEKGELLGCMVNFACHATASPGGISANWIYFMEQTIQGAMHTKAPVVFLAGACGDITQVDNLSDRQRPAAEDWSKLVGGRVGAEAVKVMLGMSQTKTSEVKVDLKQKIWNIKRRVPNPEKVKKATELVTQPRKPGDATEWTFAKETVMLDALVKHQPECEVEVQAIQLGPLALVSNPAEYFVNNGLRIKKESPFPITFIVELANGCTGYVPTEEAFGPNGGGYETRLTYYSNLEVTAGTQMADAGIELTRSMKPAPAPEAPKAPPFKLPWSYGNVPPETE